MVLQGDSRPDAGWSIPLTVRFFPPGANVLNDTPAQESKLTTARSAAGDTVVCDAPGLIPGTYDITVLGESTLVNVKRGVVVSPPSTSVDLGMLLEGNANQDNTIDLDDCAVLSAAWLASKEQPQYDIRADFDRNGLVNAADLSLLAANWLKSSPVEIQP
jgi:hypothetical protein